MKRIIAAILAAVLIIGIWPVSEVLANTQMPVNNLTITNLNPPSSDAYRFQLRWSRPLSGVGDISAHESGNDGQADTYEMFYRNATAGQAEQQSDPLRSTANDITTDDMAPLMDPGSLYVFRIRPSHIHETYNTQTGIWSYNSVYPSERGAQALYLTDINVTARGAGNYMTVTWDNPALDGRDIFTGYQMSYAISDGSDKYIELKSNDPQVSVTDPDLTLQGGKFTYSFYVADLEPGYKYAVKIEPIYNGALLRHSNIREINYNGESYSIAYSDYRTREYRTNEVSVEMPLNAVKENDKQVRIWWDSLKTTQAVKRIEIYASTSESLTPSRLVATLLDNNAKEVNFVYDDMNTGTVTHYWMLVFLDGYDDPIPSQVVPYDPAYNDFTPYSPVIEKVSHTEAMPASMTVDFQAFIREAYNDIERQNLMPDDRYLDRDLEYYIWITDNVNRIDTLNDDQIIVPPIDALNLGMSELNPSCFTASFNEYLNADTGEKMALEDNKVYYIKIEARRKVTGQLSRPAYGSHYIPPLDDIATDPQMISKPPLRIKRDSSDQEVITESSITIQWDKKWVEVYNEEDNSWYSKVGIDANKKIVFGTDINDAEDEFVSLNRTYFITGDATGGYSYNEAKVREELAVIGITKQFPIRLMDMKNASYEIHVAEYDLMTVDPFVGYEDYLAEINKPEYNGNTDIWSPITPAGDPEHPEFEVTNCNNPSGGLDRNTAYIIFFRPYVVVDGKRVAYYPAFVVGTTKDTRGPVDIKPTVPLLEAVSETDMTLTVRWEYTPELTYELAFSENLADYKDNGTVIPWSAIVEDGELRAENGKTYAYYTVTDLFPETLYHLWIRSIAQNSTGPEASEWSNPISMTTKDIQAPLPPGGLGPASMEHVELYNKLNSIKYQPIDYNYIIIEWMRDMKDNADTSDAAMEEAVAELLMHPNITNMYMVKFNELAANRAYYIRAKTVMTVTKTDEGVRRLYSYIVQLSPDADFTDMVEITVPAIEDLSNLDPVYTKRKESEWGTVIILYTDPTTNEYDSDKNPNQYPLPVQDYEITYDTATDTLTFRFRSDKSDASGARDNSVDQRFISKLVAERVFNYEVDLSVYNNHNVANRVIELPYSIFSAFEERKISLVLKADNLTATFSPGSLNTVEVKALSDFGMGANVRIIMNEYPSGLSALGFNEAYASKPQKLSIQVITPTRSISLVSLAKDIKLDMKLENRYAVLDRNVGAYFSDKNTVGWQREPSDYNNVSGALSLVTPNLANYSAIAVNAPAIINADDTVDAMYNITSKINIKDMYGYVPDAEITAGQFNNLVAAVAKDSKNVDINKPLSSSDTQSLSRAGILVNGASVTRVAGINALVKLYELKTRTAVKYYPSLEETAYTEIAEAEERYRLALLKAEELGFYGDNADARLMDTMKFGEVFYMLDIIMQDAGM